MLPDLNKTILTCVGKKIGCSTLVKLLESESFLADFFFGQFPLLDMLSLCEQFFFVVEGI